MNTENILKVRDVYRDATVKFVNENFHLFKLNDKLLSFDEMADYVYRTRKTTTANKSERRWFVERVMTILRHEHSNYDELIKQMPTKECGDRFAYLARKKLKDFAWKNYDCEIMDKAA
jgi:hypothetical protein